MPETLREPVHLDRVVEIRQADAASKVLDKPLDYGAGSGLHIREGIDGSLRFFFDNQEVLRGGVPELVAPPIPEGWESADFDEIGRRRLSRATSEQLTGSPAAIDRLQLAYRDRTDFSLKDHMALLQAGDLVTVEPYRADIQPWRVTAKIGAVSLAGQYVNIVIASRWLYTGAGDFGQYDSDAQQPTWVNMRAYPGSGCMVSFLRPGRTPAFTPRRVWAERVEQSSGEEMRMGGEAVPSYRAVYRLRYDPAIAGLTADGRLIDDTAVEWDIAGLTELGRRRYLDVECRRIGAA